MNAACITPLVFVLLVAGMQPFAALAWGEMSQAPFKVALANDAKGKVQAAVDARDYDTAIRLLDAASSADPFDEEAKAYLGMAYDARGWDRVEAGNFEDAFDDFRRASLAEPGKQAGTYLGLGFGAFMLKKYDDALYYLEEAEYLDPKDYRARELVGDIYYKRGKLGEAVKEWELALEARPDDQGLQDRLAKARKELGVEGSFTKKETYSFNIKYEGEEKRELGDEVLNILEDASSNVGGDLGYYPREPVTVILYTREQFTDLTDAPSWSGGVFDGIIRIPIGGANINHQGLAAVLYHEYTHAVIHMMAENKVPTWLNEGIAQYEEHWIRTPVAELGEGGLMPLASLDGSFMAIKDPERAKLAYAESLSAVSYYADRYGMYSLGKLVRLIGEGSAVTDAMRETAGVSLEYFEETWLGSIGRQIKPA